MVFDKMNSDTDMDTEIIQIKSRNLKRTFAHEDEKRIANEKVVDVSLGRYTIMHIHFLVLLVESPLDDGAIVNAERVTKKTHLDLMELEEGAHQVSIEIYSDMFKA